jgi:hypothetical protein
LALPLRDLRQRPSAQPHLERPAGVAQSAITFFQPPLPNCNRRTHCHHSARVVCPFGVYESAP